MIAMVVVLLLVLVAIFADFVAPYPYDAIDRLTLCSIPVRSTGWERTTSAVIS